MWLKTRMQPPWSGIFSPSIQVRRVTASSVGFTMGTATLKVHPRLCWSLRTVTKEHATAKPLPPGGRIEVMSRLPCVVLVPVKPPAIAKSRLAVDDVRRTAYARAFALDTIAAARAVPDV